MLSKLLASRSLALKYLHHNLETKSSLQGLFRQQCFGIKTHDKAVSSKASENSEEFDVLIKMMQSKNTSVESSQTQ